MISFDDFKKLEIKIGTIISVEDIEGADKLLKLDIDLGEETNRQIVSGIKEYFEDFKDLIGKQVPVLINLEPREIRGTMSYGMILAVGSNDEFILLTPEKKVKPGSEIR